MFLFSSLLDSQEKPTSVHDQFAERLPLERKEVWDLKWADVSYTVCTCDFSMIFLFGEY